jgi:iron complex transport system ATP-binding protein
MILIIGPNGCGKSTMLKTLAGLIKPLAGNIIYKNKDRFIDISKTDAKTLAQLRAIVLTKPPDTGILTALEVVLLGRLVYSNWNGNPTHNDYIKAEKALKETASAHLAERVFNTLSDGEKQKIMVARALAQDTPIIFLDEPSSFLDIPSRIELFGYLKKISKNKTVIIATHDLELAFKSNEEIWIIDYDGTVYTENAAKIKEDSTNHIDKFKCRFLKAANIKGLFLN